MMGVVERIWRKRAKRGPMDRLEAVRMDPRSGIEGNADCYRKRQVTILSLESWRDVERELGREVDPATRRTNLLVSGIDLVDSRGKTLQVGDVHIRIWGETRPCRQMEEACDGLQAALDPEWRAGAHGEVVVGGEVRVGDIAVLRHQSPVEAGAA